MVIILQLCIFAVFVMLRGFMLFGSHLRPVEPGSDVLGYNAQIYRERLARHVGLACSGGIPFIVRREKPYHRLLKSIGMSSEINVGNPDFDFRYFITTDFPGHLEQLLASRNLQRLVQELFKLPVKSQHATPDRIWCVIAAEDLWKSADGFEEHLGLLRQILEETRAARLRGPASPGRRWLGIAAVCVIAVQAGLLTLGLLGVLTTFADTIHTTFRDELVVMGSAAGLMAAGVWCLLLVAVFRGSSWCAWVLADFVLAGLLGFALTGIFVVRDLNINLPQPDARIYQQPVVQRICKLTCDARQDRRTVTSSYVYDTDADCSASSRWESMSLKRRTDPICASRAWFEYRLVVRHWRKSSRYSFIPGVGLFDAVKTGDKLRFPVHPGALGLEWVDLSEVTAP